MYMSRVRCGFGLLVCLVMSHGSWATQGIDAALETSGARVQAPAALSVGTLIDLHRAAQTLAEGFASVAGQEHDLITRADLERVARGRDTRLPEELLVAARFFLVSPVSRALAGEGGQHAASHGMTRAGLQAVRAINSNTLDQDLQRLVANTGADGQAHNPSWALVLRDPGVPAPVRAQLLAALPDSRLTQLFGRPNTQGDSRDTADELLAFAGLIRVSWLGAQEAQALAHYRIPLVMDRGAQDRDVSYWNGQNIHLSEQMITRGKPGYLAELLAHEGGHAIFEAAGLKARVYGDLERAGVTAGTGQIVNEGFAGVFGNRAHVALFGLGDRRIDRHLLLVNDVDDSLASDASHYARLYHVNTAAARARIAVIHQIMATDLLPYLQETFALLGDPQLTLGLGATP